MPLTTAQYNALNNSGGSGSATGSTTGGFGKWASDNSTLIGALGAGLGGILGLKGGSGDTQGSSGYQGGIPEYTYDPTIKDNAFTRKKCQLLNGIQTQEGCWTSGTCQGQLPV